jgi:hypothetical protein
MLQVLFPMERSLAHIKKRLDRPQNRVDMVMKRKISAPARNQAQVVQPVAVTLLSEQLCLTKSYHIVRKEFKKTVK